MFFKLKETQELEESVEELKAKHKREILELELRKKLEIEDIKHLIKIKEEKDLAECRKREIEYARTKDEEVLEIRKEYSDRVEKFLEEQVREIKTVQNSILERLPNIDVKLSGNV